MKKTLEQIMSEQYDLLCRAISKSKKDNLSMDISYISPNNHKLNMMNPYSLARFSDMFFDKYSKITNLSKDDIVLSATLIDEEFDFGSKKGKFNINKAKKRFKKILSGLDYIGNVTFGMYKSEKKSLEEGYLRSVHCHLLLLSPLSRRQHNKISNMVNIDKNKGIPLLVKEYPLKEAVSYIWHAPLVAYSSIPNKKTGKLQQIKTKPTLKALYDLYNKYKDCKIYDWTISGGSGVAIWKGIKEELDTCFEENIYE